jgi:uncharacterized membrane protein
MIDWGHSGPAVIAAFVASLVEFVEALTIVLAVGVTRGWRWALIGTAADTLLLILLTLGFGPALQLVPLATLQIVVGILLLLSRISNLNSPDETFGCAPSSVFMRFLMR